MTRTPADFLTMDKTLLLSLELKRQERRRNLRYRTSVEITSEAIKKSSPHEQKVFHQKTTEEYAKDLEQWLKKMKCTGVTGIRLESFAEIKVGMNEDPPDPSSPSLEPYPNLWGEKFSYKGYRDDLGRAKGRAVIEMENGDLISGMFTEGLRHGECRIETSRNNLSHIVGNYVRDQLHGKAKVTFDDGQWMEAIFAHGILHGFARKYDEAKGTCQFGYYVDGIPSGIWWRLIRDGGAIVGPVDEQGDLTGTEIVFLYPDFKTGLMGQFLDGELCRAQVVHLECAVNEYKMMVPLFSEPQGPHYIREISDYEKMTSQPTLPDPYESKMVEVRASSVPGANDGLFVRNTVPAGTILAFYNGIRRPPKQTFDDPDWTVCAYKIFDPTRKKGSLDIPPDYVDLTQYRATLAHKTNHSFLPSAEFDAFHHPCFGLIPCLITQTSIQADEEVFVHYCYGLDRCPDWYTDAWAAGNYPVPSSFQDSAVTA